MAQKNRNVLSLILITSLFFFWGVVHNLDPILIPHLRNAFTLSHFMASLVDSAIFIAYFIMAIPAGIFMQKYGYKKGIMLGLGFFALGCFLFIPAAITVNYLFFLVALFVTAIGLATLETGANPYVAILGDPESATQRLNFAQSFNGLAACLAPIIGGKLIFSGNEKTDAQIALLSATDKMAYLKAQTALVKTPYFVLGILIVIVLAIFAFIKMPDITESNDASNEKGVFRVLRHKNVLWAVVAQFFYIGAQISILSFLVVYATEVAHVPTDTASKYSGLAGLVFMIGRFSGTYLMKFISGPKLLAIYAFINVGLTLYVILGSGSIYCLYALVAIAFFMSIMFATIFAIGVQGVGAETKSASSLIVMSLVGGAVLPPLLGLISDKTKHFQYGYVVPLVCFAVVFLFAIKNRHADLASTEKLQGH